MQVKNNANVKGVFFLAVILNSIILAATDFSKVKANGDLERDGSSRNSLAIDTDILFVIVFTIECVIKIIAMGLFSVQGECDYG